MSTATPWYGLQRWRRRAAHQLRLFPLCGMCLAKGDTTLATVADHVIPHRGDAELFWHGELQSMCDHHHSQTKQREETRGYAEALDDDGWPSDPKHPANAHSGARGEPPAPSGGPTEGEGRVKSLRPFAPRPAGDFRAQRRENGGGGGSSAKITRVAG